MRTAIIFSGFFRTFDHVKESLATNVINTFNDDECDIFFSAPKTMFSEPKDEVSEYHHIHAQNDQLVGANVFDFFGSKLKTFELRDYDAQFYKDELVKYKVPESNFCKQYTWRILSQLHSTWFSLNLFKKYITEHNITYDHVILARGDVKYHSRLDLGQIDWKQINYPSHAMFEGRLNILSPNARPSPTLDKAFNDQMLIGTQSNILTFHSLYSNVMTYFKQGIDFNHETMMGTHLRKNNVEWCGTPFILYELCRRADSIFPPIKVSARDRRIQRAKR